jgi:hypothetical protein
VGLTGAKKGDTLVGTNRADGVVLEIVSGEVYPIRKLLDDDSAPTLLSAAWYCSEPEARQRIQAMEPFPGDKAKQQYLSIARHQTVGQSCSCRGWACDHPSTCQVRILSLGGLLAKVGPAMQNRLKGLLGKASCSPQEMVACLGKQFLQLSYTQFNVSDQYTPLSAFTASADKRMCIDLRSTGDCHTESLAIGASDAVFLIAPGEVPIYACVQRNAERSDVLSIMRKAHDSECKCGASEEERDGCLLVLRKLGVGGLKSVLQKLVRFGAARVSLPSEAGVPTCCAALMLCAAFGLCVMHRGHLDHVLHVMVRGVTDAFKRLAVTTMEDAIRRSRLSYFLGVALMTQRYPQWTVPEDTLLAGAVQLCRIFQSPAVLDWRIHRGSKRKIPALSAFSWNGVDEPEAALAHRLLRAVGSLGGDYEMMACIARSSFETTTMSPAMEADRKTAIVPFCHLVDPHAFPYMSHMLTTQDPLGKRFGMTFNTVTGFNPRRGEHRLRHGSYQELERDPFTVRVRAAQILCLQTHGLYLDRVVRLQRRSTDTAHKVSDVGLSYAHLASAVGHIEVQLGRKKYIMVESCYPDRAPTVLMKPAARDPKKIDYFRVDKDTARKVIKAARSESVTIKRTKYPVPGMAGEAQYSDGWTINGEPWDEYRENAVEKVSVPEFEAKIDMDNAIGMAVADDLDGAVGIATTAFDRDIPDLVRRWGRKAVLRALSWTRAQWARITVPTLGLDNKQQTKMMAAYDHDPCAFQFLCGIALVAPSAIRLSTSKLPCFDVRNGILLRKIERCIVESSRVEPTREPGQKRWDLSTWGKVPADQPLRPLQRTCIDRLIRQYTAEPGRRHFMQTSGPGSGKTQIMVEFLRFRLQHDGDLPEFIIWVVPERKTYKSMRLELGRCGIPVVTHDIHDPLVPFRVNVLCRDDLRLMHDELIEDAHRTAIVFDELDGMFRLSGRSSAALELARLCCFFMSMSATLIRDGSLDHLPWVQLMCPHLCIHKDNWMVAFDEIVRESEPSPYEVKYSVEYVPFPDEEGVRASVKEAYRAANSHRVYTILQEVLDPQFVRRIVELVREHKGKRFCNSHCRRARGGTQQQAQEQDRCRSQ